MNIINFIIPIIIKPWIIINLYINFHEWVLIYIFFNRGDYTLLKYINTNTHSWGFKKGITVN